jgi:hypothetical protein
MLQVQAQFFKDTLSKTKLHVFEFCTLKFNYFCTYILRIVLYSVGAGNYKIRVPGHTELLKTVSHL